MMAPSQNPTTVFLSGLSTLIGTAKPLISLLCTDRLALDTQHSHSTPYISYFILLSLPLYFYLIWSLISYSLSYISLISLHLAALRCKHLFPQPHRPHLSLSYMTPLVSSHFPLSLHYFFELAFTQASIPAITFNLGDFRAFLTISLFPAHDCCH